MGSLGRWQAAACVGPVLMLAVAGCSGAKSPPPVVVSDGTETHPSRPPRPGCDAPPSRKEEDSSAGSPTPSVASPDNPQDSCALADSNIGAAEEAILAAAGASRASAPSRPWNHRTKPERFDVVDRRFHLDPNERALIDKNGFVVSGRLGFGTYSWALHELYESQVPIYVSADAIFHAVYASNDKLIAAIETTYVSPLLAEVLDSMRCALPDAASNYPPEVARDLDVYLAVARALLTSAPTKTVLGEPRDDAQAADLVRRAVEAKALATIELFGRDRVVDFTQYTPRGHYVGDRAPFFRAAMWLSRIELNLVSRSCRSSQPGIAPDPSETPREDIDALALADLADRAHATVSIDLLDRSWGLLAGKREDISLSQLQALRRRAGIDTLTLDAAPKLRAAIGDAFQRTARLHYMPEGTTTLPAITTLLGPRVVPDATAARVVTDPEVQRRKLVHVADMAYALGQDRALVFLKDDLATFPDLRKQLEVARSIVSAPLPKEDLYSAWLGAIRDLAHRPLGHLPSFMSTEAFSDLRVDQTVAAFGQIRHNYVLIAGQAYDLGGCEVPDGWIDPVPDVYEALLDYAKRGDAMMRKLDPKDTLGARAYFARVDRVLRTLRVIATDELAGRALTDAERRFLSLVAENRPGGTGGPPTYTGWYFDLFRDRIEEGLSDASFIADTFTSTDLGKIVYAGVKGVRLGVFVVDVGGPPRMMVGPVARGFEHLGPLEKRLDDEGGRALASVDEPWATSYTPERAASEPPLLIGSDQIDPGGLTALKVRLRSTRDLGPITLELLDHHRLPYISRTVRVGTQETSFVLANASMPKGMTLDGMEGVHIRAGSFDLVQPMDVGPGGPYISMALGGMKAPEP
jgi:hypothetical protein